VLGDVDPDFPVHEPPRPSSTGPLGQGNFPLGRLPTQEQLDRDQAYQDNFFSDYGRGRLTSIAGRGPGGPIVRQSQELQAGIRVGTGGTTGTSGSGQATGSGSQSSSASGSRGQGVGGSGSGTFSTPGGSGSGGDGGGKRGGSGHGRGDKSDWGGPGRDDGKRSGLKRTRSKQRASEEQVSVFLFY
jgi:hypothetical protein